MAKLKLILLAFCTFALFLIGLNRQRFTSDKFTAVFLPVKSTQLTQSTNLPSSRLQPEVVKNFLERQEINSAVVHIEQGWKQQYEEYVQGKLPSNQVFDTQQIQQILHNIHQRTGKKSALIYALNAANNLELIVVSSDQPPIHKRVAGLTREALQSAIAKFRRDIVNPDSQAKDYQASGKKVYDLLIAPLDVQLQKQGINNLIFCLGGGLRTVPLAALYDGKKFLIEKYSLGIIPAFNLLDFQPRDIKRTQVLAMGASEFKNKSPLPAVPLELANITEDKWEGKSLLNQDFTIANLKKEREIYPFGIVHLATHANLSPGSIDKSYIQFWDAQVRLDELKSLGLDKPTVQLLVLSACRTALEDKQAELGFAGLAVQSGAKATLASLWSVDDSATFALMSQFYEQLKANPVKAEALRQAQITMVKQRVNWQRNLVPRDNNQRGNNPQKAQEKAQEKQILAHLKGLELSHPYYWSGFTLIGNPW